MTIRSHQHGHPAHWDRRPDRTFSEALPVYAASDQDVCGV